MESLDAPEKPAFRPIAAGARLLHAPRGGPYAAALADAIRGFNRGDFNAVRSLSAQTLAAADSTDEERALAKELRQRTGIDPLALIVGAVALVLLAVAAFFTLWG